MKSSHTEEILDNIDRKKRHIKSQSMLDHSSSSDLESEKLKAEILISEAQINLLDVIHTENISLKKEISVLQKKLKATSEIQLRKQILENENLELKGSIEYGLKREIDLEKKLQALNKTMMTSENKLTPKNQEPRNLSSVSEEASSVLKERIAHLENKLRKAKSDMEWWGNIYQQKVQKKSAEFNNQSKQINKIIDQLEKDKSYLQIENSQLIKRIEDYCTKREKQFFQHKKEMDSIVASHLELSTKFHNEIAELNNKIKEKNRTIERQNDIIKKLEDKQEELQEDNRNQSKMLESCYEEIDYLGEFLKKQDKLYQEKNLQLQKENAQVNFQLSELGKFQLQIEELSNTIQVKNKTIEKQNDLIKKFQPYIQAEQIKLSKLQQANQEQLEIITSYTSQMNHSQKEIEKLHAILDKQDELHEEMRQKLKRYEVYVLELQQEKKNLTEKNAQLNIIKTENSKRVDNLENEIKEKDLIIIKLQNDNNSLLEKTKKQHEQLRLKDEFLIELALQDDTAQTIQTQKKEINDLKLILRQLMQTYLPPLYNSHFNSYVLQPTQFNLPNNYLITSNLPTPITLLENFNPSVNTTLMSIQPPPIPSSLHTLGLFNNRIQTVSTEVPVTRAKIY